MHRLQQQLEQGIIFNMLSGKLVNQLSNIEGAGGKPEVALQRQEAINRLTADYSIQVSPARKQYLAMGTQLKMSGQLAARTLDPPGSALTLTQVGCVALRVSI